MLRISAAMLLAVLVAAPPLAARADEDEHVAKPAIADTVGVVEVDAAARRFTVESQGERRTYRVDDATRIVDGSEAISLADLEPGDRVVVDAQKRGEKQALARYVSVVRQPRPGAR
jgi:Domain of unknown function (DUF5666)